MTRQELVATVARRLHLPRARAAEIVDLLFGNAGIIASELRRGGRVQISGFGSFETRRRAARKGRNPATNEEMTLAPAVVPAFRPGKGLKDVVARRR